MLPDEPQMHHNLGCALFAQDRFTEAMACFVKAAQLAPTAPRPCHNLGLCLTHLERWDEALFQMRRAMHLSAHDPLMHKSSMFSDYAHALQRTCSWADLPPLLDQLRGRARAETAAPLAPFVFVHGVSAPEDQLACSRAWSGQHVAPWERFYSQIRRHAPRTARPERLRVGYLSADFRAHSTGMLMAEVFELHDKSRYAVTGYALSPADGSPWERRIRGSCDHWVDLHTVGTLEAAQRIADDQLDVLIEVNGPVGGGRIQVLALRVAPVQAHFLAFPGTTGAPGVDYFIADPFTVPCGQERFYSERVVLLPDSYQCNDRQRACAERTPTRAECGLPAGGFVWCCFNNATKITPPIWDIWMRLLAQTPGSVLWLFADNAVATANLRREAQVRGVAPERIVFGPRMEPADHLARYRLASLFLDTTPCGAHTTASDALWARLPVLTCAGQTFASRVAGSLLHAVGLPELITHALADYETLAVALAQHPHELAALRERLAAGRDTCPLFDTPRYVRSLERAYEMMYAATMAGDTSRTPLVVPHWERPTSIQCDDGRRGGGAVVGSPLRRLSIPQEP